MINRRQGGPEILVKRFSMTIIAYHPHTEELEKLCYHLITEGENLVAFTESHEHFRALVAEQKNQAALLVIDPPIHYLPNNSIFPHSTFLEPPAQSAPVLMERAGYVTHSSFEEWRATSVVQSAPLNAEAVLRSAEKFFTRHNPRAICGLDNLPACWLAQLPELVAKWMEIKSAASIVEAIIHVEVVSGVLDLRFATRSTFPDIYGLSRLDEFRIWLNLNLRPNRYSNPGFNGQVEPRH